MSKNQKARFSDSEDWAARREQDPAQSDRIAQLESQITNLQKLIANERPIQLPAKLSQDREAWYQKLVIELSVACLERTQAVAYERWGGETDMRYEVDIKVQKGQPKPDLHPMIIPARSEYEAKGRYEELFGITAIDATIKIVCTPLKEAA